MVEPMTPARFAAILDAYGADPRLWPDAERAAAIALAADRSHAGLLAQAAALDVLIALPPATPASAALREAIIATAPLPGARRRSLWWAGAGLGAALAGAVAGAVTVGVLAPRGADASLSADQAASASTVFSSLDEGDL